MGFYFTSVIKNGEEFNTHKDSGIAVRSIREHVVTDQRASHSEVIITLWHTLAQLKK